MMHCRDLSTCTITREMEWPPFRPDTLMTEVSTSHRHRSMTIIISQRGGGNGSSGGSDVSTKEATVYSGAKESNHRGSRTAGIKHFHCRPQVWHQPESGTIMADPNTGLITSASFTITGATSYTVASATIDPYYVHISPTQITVDAYNPSNPLGYGNLRLTGTPSGTPAFDVATLQWYTSSDPWMAGNNTIAAYTGVVNNNSGKARGADFGTSVTLYPPRHQVVIILLGSWRPHPALFPSLLPFGSSARVWLVSWD